MKSTLLPADTFMVINKTIFNDQDRKLLMRLYQPIIGGDAINLYFNLWSHLDNLEFVSNDYTHHYLFNLLQLSIDAFVSARMKLEAIGLIKTYVKEDSINNYIYELYSPLSPSEFLGNPLLNTLLLSNVGKKEFDAITNMFKIPTVNLKEHKDITSSFSDVFFISSEANDFSTVDLKNRQTSGLSFDIGFDLEECIASIPSEMLNIRSVNKTVRELIVTLAFVYNYNLEQMTNIIRDSISEKHTIDREALRVNARNYYTFNNRGKLPNIVFKCQPEYLRKPIGDTSKMAQTIYMFETISPYEFLSSKIGTKPSKSDLAILEHLAVDLALPPGVINVLLDFVLKTTNNKLAINYVDTIASQWKRSKIQTVEDAINFAKNEYSHRKKKSVSVTKEPDWFEKEVVSSNATTEEKQSIDDLLKEFR